MWGAQVCPGPGVFGSLILCPLTSLLPQLPCAEDFLIVTASDKAASALSVFI